MAASFGVGDSTAVSGAGANAENRIIGREGINNVSSYISASSVYSDGDVALEAKGNSKITSDIISAAASAAASGAFAASAAIGSSTASNYVGSIDVNSAERLKVKAGIEQASVVSASQSISIIATESMVNDAFVDSFAVALAVGANAVSASGAGVDIHSVVGASVTAGIDGNSTLHAIGGNVSVHADDTTDATAEGLASSISASAGAFAGAVSVGVALSDVEVANTVLAEIDNATITVDNGDLIVRATDNVTVNSSSEAAAIAAGFSLFSASISLSGGGAQADAIVRGSTEAEIGNSTITLTEGTLSVDADQDVTVNSTSGSLSIAGSLNSLAAGGSVANIEISPSITASLEDSTIYATDISVVSTLTPSGLAKANGLSAGPGAAVGVSETEVILNSTLESQVGGSGTITAQSLNVESLTDRIIDENNVEVRKTGEAVSVGTAGALLGTTSTHADVQNAGSVTSRILDQSDLNVQMTSIFADSSATHLATADSYAGGALAFGVSKAIAESSTTVTVEVGANSTVDGTSLTLTSQRVHSQLADTLAGSGGLGIAGASASSQTSQRGDVTTSLGDRTTVHLSGEYHQSTIANTTLNGTVVSYAGGILAGGGAYTDNSYKSNVISTIGQAADITASRVQIAAGNTFQKPDVGDNILGATGGLISGASATSTTTLDQSSSVDVKPNAIITVAGPDSNEDVLILNAQNIIDAYDTVTFATGGAISGARADSVIQATNDRSTVTLGRNAELNSAGRVVMSARGTGSVTTKTNEDVFGLGTVGVFQCHLTSGTPE